MAVGRDSLGNMGYVLFDSALLPASSIAVLQNPGGSPDEGANPFHRDLVVSGNKLVALTRAILEHGESGTVLKARLKQLVADGIRDKQLPATERITKLIG